MTEKVFPAVQMVEQLDSLIGEPVVLTCFVSTGEFSQAEAC